MLQVEQLKAYMPFKGLDERYLEEAIKHVRVETHAKGTMLFKRGKSVASRYYLVEGKIDLIDSGYYVTLVDSSDKTVENTLNEASPTACSALAKSSVTVFTIDRDVLDRIIAWSQSVASAESVELPEEKYGEGFEVAELGQDEGDWMSSLLQSPLFERIPLTQVQELFTRFEDFPVANGETVVHEGEEGDYFYVLASGAARVFNLSESVDVELKPGSYFGEEALLGNTFRNATVEMTSAGMLKRLNRENFNALLKGPVLEYIDTEGLEKLSGYKLLDVKMPIEYRMSNLPGSINIPLSRLRATIPELATSNTYVVSDDAGSRAEIAAHLLCQAGFDAYILSNPVNPVINDDDTSSLQPVRLAPVA